MLSATSTATLQGSDRGDRNGFISERSSRGCSSPTNDSYSPPFDSSYILGIGPLPRSRSGVGTEPPSPSKALAQSWSFDGMDRGYGRWAAVGSLSAILLMTYVL